jgi:hypothetical protein
MKIIIKAASVVVGLSVLLSCSGCFYLTRSVSNIGIREERLQTKNILVATNGAVALACTAIFVNPSVNFSFYEDKRSEISRCGKFLIGSPEVVRWTVTNALVAQKREQQALSRNQLRSNRDMAIIAVQTNLVIIKQLVYASTNTMNWKVTPSSHGGHDASEKDLPEAFRYSATNYQSNQHILYLMNGQSLLVQLPGNNYSKNRVSRTWWGYLLQILIIPAVAIDIVGAPVEFVIGAREFGKRF